MSWWREIMGELWELLILVVETLYTWWLGLVCAMFYPIVALAMDLLPTGLLTAVPWSAMTGVYAVVDSWIPLADVLMYVGIYTQATILMWTIRRILGLIGRS